MTLVNPEIELCPFTESGAEGCLSIPNVFENIRRAQAIHVKARTVNDEPVEFTCGGYLARAIQHEVDHLDGKMFYDHLPLDKRAALLKKYQRVKSA